MAVQTDFLDVGFFISGGDYRNSTITGTTLSGVNGSGQFLLVNMATGSTDLTIVTSTLGSTQVILGVLQNKPSTGQAADVKIVGVSKVVMGSTTGTFLPTAGSKLSASSVSSGCVSPFSSTASYVGIALTSPSATGAVFSALIYGGNGVLPII